MTSSGGVLKLVNKYLVQAKKLDKVEPVIAYYCRLHAAQVAMKMRKSKADEAVAGELISWCEQVHFSYPLLSTTVRRCSPCPLSPARTLSSSRVAQGRDRGSV